MAYVPISLEDYIATLPEEEQQAIERRSKELIANERRRLTLAEIRKGQNISQASVAEALGIGQEQISRLEGRKDPRLSTIQRAIAAMGGELSLIATFPNKKRIVLHPTPTGDPKKLGRLGKSKKDAQIVR